MAFRLAVRAKVRVSEEEEEEEEVLLTAYSERPFRP